MGGGGHSDVLRGAAVGCAVVRDLWSLSSITLEFNGNSIGA